MAHKINFTHVNGDREAGKEIHYGEPTPKVGDWIMGGRAIVKEVRHRAIDGAIDEVEAEER